MTGKVLIVDDEPSMCELVQADLQLRGYVATWCTSANAAVDALREGNFDVVLADVRMPGMTGVQLCHHVVAEYSNLPVVLMTGFGSLEMAVAALRAGAYDFVTKPVEMELLAAALGRAVRLRQLQNQVRELAETVEHRLHFGDILGESPAMQRVYAHLAQLAPTNTSVLLTGESGTGKELVARLIHRHSPRAAAPFVGVNCAAIPETLLESELFGHAKGAFTDARQVRQGLFVSAEGGSLFLDEIGELPLGMQAKLLRALEERVIRPVGSDREVRFDARIVSATNRDLLDAIQLGRFREDLYYRVNVVQLDLPPLRTRGTDVLVLAQHFLASFAASSGKSVRAIQPAAAEKLLAYPWPGNVRELRNVFERAVALATGDSITVEDLPDKVRQHRASQLVLDGTDIATLTSLEQVIERYIRYVLEAVQGNRTQTAQILGLDRKTLYRKLKQYGVE